MVNVKSWTCGASKTVGNIVKYLTGCEVHIEKYGSA